MEVKQFPRISPSFSAPSMCVKRSRHTREMEEVLFHSLPEDVQSLESFQDLLPHFEWEIPEEAPGSFSIVLICEGQRSKQVTHFFTEMLSRWLLPGRLLSILSVRSLDFHFEKHLSQNYTIVEVVLNVEYEKDIVEISDRLPAFLEDVRIGVRNNDYARHILEQKGLTLDEKASAVHRKVIAVTQKRPKQFDRDIFKDISHFLLNLSSDFKTVHDVNDMCRMLFAFSLFRKQIIHFRSTNLSKRQLYFKLIRTKLRYPFGQKAVLGVAITLNMSHDNEVFEEQHILKAFKSIFRDIKIVSGSFVGYQRDESIRNVYLELEKTSGYAFTQEEVRQLNQQLEDELKASIEQLVNAVYMHHNEEEIYRNIAALAQELRYVGDVPQVIISFQEHDRKTVTFNVVLVRLLRENTLSLNDLFHKLPQVSYVSRMSKVVSYLRKKHPKEANVFQVQFDKSSFQRHDYTIDLYRARQHVIEMLESLLGSVRDYNGGWLVKQLEVLSESKKLINQNSEIGNRERLIENFFYSLSPAVMRTLLSPEVICDMFLLFYKMLDETSLSSEHFQISSSLKHGCFCLLVCAEDDSFKSYIEDVTEKFYFDGNRLATFFLNIYGSTYFGFLIKDATDDLGVVFQEEVQAALTRWSKRKRRHQMLRINISRPASVDPRIGMDRTSGIIIKMLYEGLMRVGPDNKPQFGVAESYEISPDGKTYTFKLRKCQWTNGFPVIALDFEYAWKKILEPNFNNVFVYLLYPIKNAKAIKQGRCPVEKLGVKAVDSRTLVVELENPAPYFLSLTSHWAYSPLCSDIDRIHPGWSQHGSDRFVCNGPFKIAKWKDDRGLQVVKNLGYWDAENVDLQGINISVIENCQAACNMYDQNLLDWIGEPLSDLPTEELQGDTQEHPIAAVYWYQYNVDRFPFNNKKMRRAFGLAVDRKELIERVHSHKAAPAYSVIPPSISASQHPFFDDDKREALKLFEEGLAELGITREQLPPITLAYSSKEGHSVVAEAIQEQWQELFGIPIILEGVDWKVYLKHSIKHNFQIRLALWYSWYEDPTYNLHYFMYRDDEMNATQWEHPEYIHLIDMAEKSVEKEKRDLYLIEAEAFLLEEMPVVPICYYSMHYKSKPGVKNIYISNIGQIDFKWASIAQM